MRDQDTQKILEQFNEITKIPRPSCHEEQICAYLEKWALDRGFKVIRDTSHNIIMDIPATKGRERQPVVALQAHMDMVFAQKGNSLDPLTTVIHSVDKGACLTSDGNTSLGADNGIGMALALYAASGGVLHGPLRIIITSDEEETMTGVNSLDKAVVQDVPYLINLDSFEEGIATISSVGGNTIWFSVDWEPLSQTKPKNLMLEIDKLSGGHSGFDIDKGRLNGALVMGAVLNKIRQAGVEFELRYLQSGIADNVIPSLAQAFICVNAEDVSRVKEIFALEMIHYQSQYAQSDPNLCFSFKELSNQAPGEVIPVGGVTDILYFLTNLPNGMYSWLAGLEGFKESSSNLGIVKASEKSFFALTFIRSCSQKKLDEITNKQLKLAQGLGMKTRVCQTADAWPPHSDSTLLKVAQRVFLQIFGTELAAQPTHTALECGTFLRYKPDLDIISIGPTITNAHSVKESLDIDSVSRVWKLLKGILGAIE